MLGTPRSTRPAAALVLAAALGCADGATTPRGEPGDAAADEILLALGEAGSAGQLAVTGAVATGARPSADCSYADGRYTCAPVTRDGVTITRSFAFYAADGSPQRQYDPLTTASALNEMTTRGRIERAGSTVEVDRRSIHRATGLAGTETRRVVDGTGGGTMRVTTGEQGATRTLTTTQADTTRALVLAVPARAGDPAATTPSYPLGGSVTTVTRVDDASTARGDAAARELRTTVRYDGTSVARVEITRLGVTQACTLDMAARPQRLACPGGTPPLTP